MFWVIGLVAVLTVVGSSALLFVTVKYYWGERGTPPPTREERHQQREAELALRANQIKRLKNRPYRERNPSFWDNSKNT